MYSLKASYKSLCKAVFVRAALLLAKSVYSRHDAVMHYCADFRLHGTLRCCRCLKKLNSLVYWKIPAISFTQSLQSHQILMIVLILRDERLYSVSLNKSERRCDAMFVEYNVNNAIFFLALAEVP